MPKPAAHLALPTSLDLLIPRKEKKKRAPLSPVCIVSDWVFMRGDMGSLNENDEDRFAWDFLWKTWMVG